MNLKLLFKDTIDGKSAIQGTHVLVFFLIICITPKSGFWFDMQDWTRWSTYSFEHGLGKIYESNTNYMPFYLHSLYVFGKIQGSAQAIQENIHQIKYFFLVFDFGAAIALAYSLRRYNVDKMASYYLIFNIAYLYETVLWGQLDSVPTTIVVLAFICLLQKRMLWAAFFCTVSIYIKLQTVIFLPFFVILFFYQFANRISGKIFWQMFVVSLITQLCLLSPFLWNGTFFSLLKVVRESVGFFPRASWNAYNFWYLILRGDPTQIPDSSIFLRITYQKWGFLLFTFFSGLALFPLVYQTWKYVIQKKVLDTKYLVDFWLTAGLISIIFFYFNTEMHERYSFPALVMYFAYALLTGRYFLYIAVSVAHLINIDSVYQVLHLNFVKPELVAVIYLLILFVSFYEIYGHLSWSQLSLSNKSKYVLTT